MAVWLTRKVQQNVQSPLYNCRTNNNFALPLPLELLTLLLEGASDDSVEAFGFIKVRGGQCLGVKCVGIILECGRGS